ncbi:hypothetical protein [Propionicimonas sp.]|uniref:hypothetical protein n=1 Tax=Propionicimonas sp. TaxID=1955623 RepID=UPI0039E4A987
MVPLMLVTPAWLPLAMVGVLILLLAFLYWSMHRNINRIDIEDEPAPESPVSPLD